MIVVGLESGTVPPRTQGSVALRATLDEWALREMYLSFTRAREAVVVINGPGSQPSPLLKEVLDRKLLTRDV